MTRAQSRRSGIRDGLIIGKRGSVETWLADILFESSRNVSQTRLHTSSPRVRHSPSREPRRVLNEDAGVYFEWLPDQGAYHWHIENQGDTSPPTADAGRQPMVVSWTACVVSA